MDLTVEKKLRNLYELQAVDTALDNLKAMMGELPMEVADLEDEIIGLETRLTNIEGEIGQIQDGINAYRTRIKECNQQIDKYKEQLNQVKNNREYDALNKEIEILGLEILQAEKSIKMQQEKLDTQKEILRVTGETLENRRKDLEFKRVELKTIEKENEEEMTRLGGDREKAEKDVDPRLLKAYNRIRKNVINGIAVASILRGSCGGCFARIPPQRQSDIRAHFKIIDCEHCGRILVDVTISGQETIVEVKEEKPATRKRLKLGAKAE
jgi:predicted  nucleic acid-binding Zn-ribbon protein